MHIDPAAIVEVELTGIASLLKPVVFSDGGKYCCLTGTDPQTGVMGCGDTPALAIADWDQRLKVHLAANGDDDYVVEYVKSFIPDTGQSEAFKRFWVKAIQPPKRRA